MNAKCATTEGHVIAETRTFALLMENVSQIMSSVMKQECSVIVRWRDFIPLILLLIVSLVCQSDRELDDRSH